LCDWIDSLDALISPLMSLFSFSILASSCLRSFSVMKAAARSSSASLFFSL